MSDEQNPRRDCEACGRQFISKIGEPYCEECSKEFEEQSDISELNRILAARGVEFIKDFIINNELSICPECRHWFPNKELYKKKIYEGTDFKEDSPINYPIAFVCRNCR